MRSHQIFVGYLCAVVATAIWSSNLIIARDIADSIAPVSLAFWRWCVAAVVLLPFAFKPFIMEIGSIKRHLPYLLVTSLLGVTIFSTLLYLASHTTTAINLSLISISCPTFIIIFARVVYQEPITFRKGLGLVLVAIGIIVLMTKGDIAQLIDLTFAMGDLWMLLAAIAFALYSVVLKNKPENLNIWPFQLSNFLLGVLFLFPFYLWENSVNPPVQPQVKVVLSILYLGIFTSLLAFILWYKAIITIGPSKAGMMYYTLPLFSAIAAHFLLNESITAVHFCSAFFIITGIITATYKTKSGVALK